MTDEKLGPLPVVRLRDESIRTVSPEDWSIDNEQGEVLARYTEPSRGSTLEYGGTARTSTSPRTDLLACIERSIG